MFFENELKCGTQNIILNDIMKNKVYAILMKEKHLKFANDKHWEEWLMGQRVMLPSRGTRAGRTNGQPGTS